jgi:hypothetical protein
MASWDYHLMPQSLDQLFGSFGVVYDFDHLPDRFREHSLTYTESPYSGTWLFHPERDEMLP